MNDNAIDYLQVNELLKREIYNLHCKIYILRSDETIDHEIPQEDIILDSINYGENYNQGERRNISFTLINTDEKYTPNVKPGKPSNASVEFKDGKLSFSWNKSSGDIWHYNIYKVEENEEISYLNLLEQTKTTSFGFTPEEKGTFYIVIQPENNMGEVGKPLKIKITLK